MAFKRFNSIPHPLIYAALVPVRSDVGLPGFDLLMPQKEFTVGRGEHNDICIRGAEISDEHCKLVWNSEKKMMFVEWLPTTNGTWIMNERYECHRLREGEAYPLMGELSFGPCIDRLREQTGPNDYLYSFHLYAEHEMEEELEPEELAERKSVRARFWHSRDPESLDAVTKCVAVHRSSTDRAPDVTTSRQATPPFQPPPPLGPETKLSSRNVGHYAPEDDPDGHDWADPDIVWRGSVPIRPHTKPVCPGDVELWSNHYGLPVGLHPEYTKYAGVSYDDTPTDFDRERLERRMRELSYIGSAEYVADLRKTYEENDQVYFSPTPSPSPEPEPEMIVAPHPPSDEQQPLTVMPPASASPAHSVSSLHSPHRSQQPEPKPLSHTSDSPLPSRSSRLATDNRGDANTDDSSESGSTKRKRDLKDDTSHDHAARRRTRSATQDKPPTQKRHPRKQPARTQTRTGMTKPAAKKPQHQEATPSRRSARLAEKPPARYKY